MKIKRDDLRRIIEEEAQDYEGLDIDNVMNMVTEWNSWRGAEAPNDPKREIGRELARLFGPRDSGMAQKVKIYRIDRQKEFNRAVREYLEGTVASEIINIANKVKNEG